MEKSRTNQEMGCLAVLALVVASAAAASATAASTCDGACYGCRDGTSASCVNASWTGAGSCTTPVGGTIYAAPLPPPHKNVNNTALPGLERPGAPVPDGVYVVPGLDVIQCCYCAHWSFTNPLALEDAAALAESVNGMRNADGDMYAGATLALTEGEGGEAEGAGGEGAGGEGAGGEAGEPMEEEEAGSSSAIAPPPMLPPPPLMELGDEADGKGAVMSWHVAASIPPR